MLTATEYQTPVQPYPHQAEALKRLVGHEAFALLMQMRTGKTKVLLDDFGRLELAGKAKELLVIAPAGVYRTWETAIKEHVSSDLQSRLLVHTWVSSKDSAAERRRREAFLSAVDRPRILLMNVEALSVVLRAKEFCIQFLHRPTSAMIVADESTTIKNPSAKRTAFITRQLARLARYRRILSGLPTPKSPLDLFGQFMFLDPRILGYSSFTTFRSRYAIIRREFLGGRWVPIITGYQNLEELQRKIEPCSFRVPFRPAIPSTYTIREVTLTEEQQRIYGELKKFATARLEADEHVTATVVIAQILRLHQVLCGHTRSEKTNTLHEIPERRTEELMDLLEEYAHGKAVIWCTYDFSVNRIVSALSKVYGSNSVARFWGGNPTTREQEEARFKGDPACRFMVATPAAGGKGRTWSVADLVVYYSSTYDLEHRDQSEMRVQGIGKERAVDYVDLVAPNTVDMVILKALRAKMNLAATVTGANWKEWLL